MNAYERLKKNKIKKLSEKIQDLFHLMHSFGKRKNNKLCKCFDDWKAYVNVKNRDLWAFQIYFYESVFCPTKTAKFAATTTWQTATSRHFLMNFLRLTEKELNNRWMNTLDKNKLTWRNYNDWPEPINNLGLCKIGDFGQLLHLWGKITVTKNRRTKPFSVKAKLLCVK